MHVTFRIYGVCCQIQNGIQIELPGHYGTTRIDTPSSWLWGNQLVT